MKPKFLNGKEKGQATIEYILLLFVVISLITGILLKFSVSFKAFADDALGDYIACLLETGELPDLEGSSASRECQTNTAMNFKGNYGPGHAGSGTGGSNSNSNDSNSDSTANASGDKKGDESGDSDGSGSNGGGSSDGSGSGGGRRGGRTSATSKGSGDAGEKSEGGDSEGISRGSRKITVIDETVRVGGSDRDSRYIPIRGEKEGAEKPENKNTVIKIDSNEIARSKKIPVTIEERKPSSEMKDEPMTFGDFLRYIIIAAVVISIVVFFGSQIMNYQNSKE